MATSHRHVLLIALFLAGCGPEMTPDELAAREDGLLGALQPKFIRSSKVTEATRPAQLDGLAVDAQGNVFITGHFTTTLQFVAGATPLSTAGGKDIFLGKYDAMGRQKWLFRYGDASEQETFDLTLTPDGREVVIGGWFQGNLNFGSAPALRLASRGGYDAFIAKFSADTGAPLWARQLGGALGDEGTNELEVDAQGFIIATATTSADFTLAGCPFTITPSGDPAETAGDSFVLKLDSEGLPLWAFQTTGPTYERIRAIGVVHAGTSVQGYVAGYQARRSLSFGATTSFPTCATTRWNRALVNPLRPDNRDWQGGVAALDVNGALLWHYALINDQGMTAVRGTSGDTSGKAYFHGTLEGTATLLGRRVDDTLTTEGTLRPAGVIGKDLETQSVLAQVDFSSGKVTWLNQLGSAATDPQRNAVMGGELDFSDRGVLLMTGNRTGPYVLKHRYVGAQLGLIPSSPNQVLLPGDSNCGFVSGFDTAGTFTSAHTPWSCGSTTDAVRGATAGVVDAKGGFVSYGGSFKGNLTYPQGTNALDAYDLPLGGQVFKWYVTPGSAETFTLLTLQ